MRDKTVNNWHYMQVTNEEHMRIIKDRHIALVSQSCKSDTPEVGTLADSNIQVGDVAEWVGYEHIGELTMDYFDGSYCVFKAENGQPYTFDKGDGPFRIITRAKPQGAVITETVKRIVPGVYGRVYVNQGMEGSVSVGLVYKTGCIGAPSLSRADLIAARDVFNQLIDAMPVAVS